ncbi:uncharacterized protein [Solanum lycopersicum]|uniref:uncharacterized protein isoform X1 n=2 Tax=Solanum lycopersicum TaxID=4081 RepID=UPI000532AE11|nr:uncharacterized protein LOC104646999 isoform X1 [Solanum lycopersicum]
MNFDKMELEKQGNMDVQFASQQTTLQQFDIINWINPYSSSIQGNICQDQMDKRKRISNYFSNYIYTHFFASSSWSRNIPFSQIQDPSPYIPFQSQEQNMVVDVQQNATQTFEKSQAQVTFDESSDNSIMNS